MTYDARNDGQHGAGVFINPGEGAVDCLDNGELLAMLAAEHLLIDAFSGDAALWRTLRALDLDADGRFGVELRGGERDWSIRIAMPGLPVEQVRYLGLDDQNIWNYPRIFIYHPSSPDWPDSWVWCFMVEALQGRVKP